MTRYMQTPREEQTELEDPIKIRFEGQLRSRIDERASDSVLNYNPDGENTVRDDAEEYLKSVYRPLLRQKTNVVFETEHEASAFYSSMEHYSMGGVTWMNGMMRKSIRRVRNQLHDEMIDRGFHQVNHESDETGIIGGQDFFRFGRGGDD